MEEGPASTMPLGLEPGKWQSNKHGRPCEPRLPPLPQNSLLFPERKINLCFNLFLLFSFYHDYSIINCTIWWVLLTHFHACIQCALITSTIPTILSCSLFFHSPQGHSSNFYFQSIFSFNYIPHNRENTWCLLFYVWLISLNIMSASSIHSPIHGMSSSFFMAE